MNMACEKLVGDIGGTNARFALLDEHDQLAHARTYAAQDHESLADALRCYLNDLSLDAPQAAAIAVATRVLNDTVEFTNNERWSFSSRAFAEELGISDLRVVNDFTAQALAAPHLPVGELRKVGRGDVQANEPIGIVGPGTGFGVSGVIPLQQSGHWRALNSEGGHCSAAVYTERERAIHKVLVSRFGHVSYERFLSGPGLVNIVTALRQIDGLPATNFKPAQVSQCGLSGSDKHCEEALHIFCGMLGSYAGDLALLLGASGGVYVGGGIVPRMGEFFIQSDFRARFEAKGRVSDELLSIPTFVITSSYPGLLGAARLLTRH